MTIFVRLKPKTFEIRGKFWLIMFIPKLMLLIRISWNWKWFCICCWIHKVYLKSLLMTTSSGAFLVIQSRTACSTMINRRSNASKCGAHKMGAIGSLDIESLIRSDKRLLPLWMLEWKLDFCIIIFRRQIFYWNSYNSL